jgi:hypothetical protein
MKRLILILLLAILPYQLSWAALASYCQDEKAPISQQSRQFPLTPKQQTPQHFGHHDHAAQVKSASAKEGEKDKSDSVSAECEICHLSCTKFFLALPVMGTPAENSALYAAQPSPIYLCPVTALPEEPDWHRAV